MAFKKLTRLIAVSSVLLGTISFLVPKSAHASPSLAALKFICQQDRANNKLPICKQLDTYTSPITMDITGSPNSGELYVDFSLNPSVESDGSDTNNKFIFKDAVQSATFLSCPNSDCNQGTLFSFGSGDLIGSLTDKGLVQYESTPFQENSKFFRFAIQVNPSGTNFSSADLLASLSNLNQFLTENPTKFELAALLNSDRDFGSGDFISNVNESIYVQVVPEPVPEPDATGSLLVAGATIALLLKRRKHPNKNCSQANLVANK
jgi:hypothetical protein